MFNNIKFLSVLLFACLNCLSLNAQLSFSIDSLAFNCFGDWGQDSSWANRMLYNRGPNIQIYGKLINEGDTPVILELYEMDESALDLTLDELDESDELMIIYKELRMYISYHYKKDYFFLADHLFTTDIRSYPFIKGMSLPTRTIGQKDKMIIVSLIKPKESIALAFESLSIPDNKSTTGSDKKFFGSRRYRSVIRRQQKRVERIKSSIRVIPVVHERTAFPDTTMIEAIEAGVYNDTVNNEYNPELSIPLCFLDNKTYFSDDGSGFNKWFYEQLSIHGKVLSGKEASVMVSFIIDRNGDIIYTNIWNVSPDESYNELQQIISTILSKSPKWPCGKVNGNAVDAKVTLYAAFNGNGEISSINIF